MILGSDRAIKAERRRFETEVQSVLQSFERAREWADLTGCLNRLHKAIGRPPQSFSYVPCQDVIARRLGQCLNPALPSRDNNMIISVQIPAFMTGKRRWSSFKMSRSVLQYFSTNSGRRMAESEAHLIGDFLDHSFLSINSTVDYS